MRNVYQIFVAGLILFLTGCASVPMASMEKDSSAKTFSPASDRASLYIYRNESFGAAIPVALSVNGKTLGQTAAMTYFHLNVLPGKYTISSHAEDVSELELSVNAGKNYFVWQEIKMGMFSARSKLQQMDEQKGRSGVSESKLIASKISSDDLATPSVAVLQSTVDENPSTAQKLRELKGLENEGVISKEEYEKKKAQLLKAL